MGGRSKHEYLMAIYQRYRTAPRVEKARILDEFCRVCGYHRKSALRLLSGPAPSAKPTGKRERKKTYSSQALSILTAVWKTAGYPWSVRLKALLPLWLPWIRKRFHLTPALERQLLTISPRQIDRRLQAKKRHLKRRLYGRTKPGTLLKHHIPIKTDHWDVHCPGYTEADLVSHSGECAEGEFAHSLTLTDIHSTWTENRAVLGKGQTGICDAIEQIRQSLPFPLRGLDSDNGSEFLNRHLVRYTKKHKLQFTRGRPYKKDDNAHVEQKNWTHVRKLVGYARYDTQKALHALNDLYQNELRLMMNLFQPSVKLIKKVRVGSRLKRLYDKPQTPLDRLSTCPEADPIKLASLQKLRNRTDPFALAEIIDQKLDHLFRLAKPHRSAAQKTAKNQNQKTKHSSLNKEESEILHALTQAFGPVTYVKKRSGHR